MKEHRVATCQFIPQFLRGSLMGAYRMCLDEIMRHTPRSEGCSRAWKAFLCIPRMLLASKIGGGKVERQSLRDRFLLFQAGRFGELLVQDRQDRWRRETQQTSPEDDLQKRVAAAERLISMGEISRARQRLAGSGLAPGTAETLAHLRDTSRRPLTLQRPIPVEVLEFEPARPLELDAGRLLQNLRSAHKGTAPGPLGTRTEHLKVILDDEASSTGFVKVCERLARGEVPADVGKGL